MQSTDVFSRALEKTVKQLSGVVTPDGDRALWIPEPKNAPQCLAYELAKSGEVMEIGYGGQAGGGKALSIRVIIPTPNGYKRIGDLRNGDEVFGMDGCIYKIVGSSDVMYDHRVFEVVFDDGTIIHADADHKWHTFTAFERDKIARQREAFREHRKSRRPPQGTGKRPDLALRNKERSNQLVSEPVTGGIRTTLEIRDSLMAGDDKRTNHAIPVIQPLELPDRELPINPYVLGFWIGDGNSYAGRITVGDEYIDQTKQIFEAEGYSLRRIPSDKMGYTVLGLQKQLRLNEFLRNKHIPEEYIFASFPQRRALLQGLMDTDGYAAPGGQCEFYTSKLSLGKSVSRLLHTLGIKHAIRPKKAPVNTSYSESYRIKFVAPFPVFRLTQKLSRQNLVLRETQKWRYIVDVREIDSEPVKCIAIDSPDHLYLAGEECVPTHNTDLIIGVAGTLFERSRIMRSEFPQLDGIIQRGNEIFPSSFVGGEVKKWRFSDRTIALRSMPNDDDWKKYQGQAIEFLGVDEAAEFKENPIRSVTGWLRTEPGKRTLVIYGFNPPTAPEGEWIIWYFAPWLDPAYPNPAKDGEIRWLAHVPDGMRERIVERPDGEPFMDETTGEMIYPISRTFVHASRRDNPYLGEEYERRLNNLKEPLRTMLKTGDMTVRMVDDPWQVIPTNWVLEAQERWRKMEKPDVALRAIGNDVAHGGSDNDVVACLYATWFAELDIYPGVTTFSGSEAAKRVEVRWDKHAPIAVDATGVGASAVDTMQEWGMSPIPINFGAASNRRDKSKRFVYFNQRAELYFEFMYALDPESGEDIALPPSRTLRADLCAQRYKIVRGKIQLEEKVAVKKRLGRSPDESDAVVLAWRAGQVLGVPVSLDW